MDHSQYYGENEECFDSVLKDVQRGRQRIVSHSSTNQYVSSSSSEEFNTTVVSTSACGLAALNCAKIVFECTATDEDCVCPDAGGVYEKTLVERLVAPGTAKDITRVCSLWTRNTHLDVEDLLATPVFQHTLKAVNRSYGKPDYQNFVDLLEKCDEVDIESQVPVAVVITRPPEIILCLRIPSIYESIFVIYDSHSRPEYPSGAGFILNNSISSTAACLEKLLAVDPRIITDASLQWQAQLLGHFSAHFLIPSPALTDPDHLRTISFESTLAILNLQCDIAELRLKNYNQEAEIKELKGQLDYRVEQKQTLHVEESQAVERRPRPYDRHGKQKAESSHTSKDVDSEMALKLQQLYDQEHEKLDSERVSLVHRQPRTFDCGICLEKLEYDYIFSANICKHPYCRPCIREYVLSSLKHRKYPILCPTCSAENNGNVSMIEQDSLDYLGLPPKEMQLYQEMQLMAHSTLLHCRKCLNSMLVDREEYNGSKVIVCPLRGCNHVWCKACQQDIPIGGPQHSCDGSTELDHLMKSKGWKHCPGCKTPILRVSGCNHMICAAPSCNTHFCYLCGELLVSSLVRSEISAAVSRHYRRDCALFEYPSR